MTHPTLIAGAGASGRSAARLLRSGGRAVALTDRAGRPSDWPEDLDDVAFIAEDPSAEELAPFGVLLLSPGVPIDAPIVTRARSQGLRITGELEEAWRLARGKDGAELIAPDCAFLAITGTNGKSTTTVLTAELLAAHGLMAPGCGNLGTPLSQALLDSPLADAFVVEVSSFQCETIEHFRPDVAAILNLAPDHESRHGGLAAYWRSKRRLFEAMSEDQLIVAGPDQEIADVLDGLVPRRLLFSLDEIEGEGAFLRDETLVTRFEGREEMILGVSELRLVGRHNVANALASLALTLPFHVSPSAAAQVLRSFAGLPHRLEPVGRLGPLECFNDSKATNIAATLATLGEIDRPVRLIAGGRAAEGCRFEELARRLPTVARVYAIGEAAEDIARAFGDRAVVTGTMEEAVLGARREGQAGEMLVLSPACKSFDQFRNFAARGDHFRELVRAAAT